MVLSTMSATAAAGGSSSEYSAHNAYHREMDYNIESAYWYSYSKSGLFSVRCIKDN